MKRIYLDNNATAPLSAKARETLLEVAEGIGNPSSVHWAGREARAWVNRSREKMAALLNAEETEILFTSGGTESINMALAGAFEEGGRKRPEILSSPIEHHATLKTLEALETRGAKIHFLKVDAKGRIDPEEIEDRLNERTLLVSLLFVHNELGNLYPIQEIGRICREKGVRLHVDAVQALGKLRIDLKNLPVDLLSFSAHKFHGPKGIGGLFIRKGLKVSPLHFGGNQERILRAGTKNVPAIAAMAAALQEALQNLEEDSRRVAALRERLEEGIRRRLDRVEINGEVENRLFNTSNLRVKDVDGESLLLNLDLDGIAASAGAACESGSIDPSHVLLAMGASPQEAKASVRFSLSKFNTREEIDYVVERFPKIVERLRKDRKS